MRGAPEGPVRPEPIPFTSICVGLGASSIEEVVELHENMHEKLKKNSTGGAVVRELVKILCGRFKPL